MKQIAIQYDDYDLGPAYEDTASKPEYNDPPPDIPPDIYTHAPSFDVAAVNKTPLPLSGDEFVFCEGKPVLVVGEVFSKLTVEKSHRKWELEDGHLGSKSEEALSYQELEVKVSGGSSYVFVDEIPVGFKEGGVSGKGDNWVYRDGVKEKAGTAQASGKFTDCKAHVFVDDE